MLFNIGASVRLNSGGPRMTVQQIEDELVTCVWFDKDLKLRDAKFRREMLNEPARLDELLNEIKQHQNSIVLTI